MLCMDKSELKVSYRSQGYTYLTALAGFARMRTHGFLPRHHDPLHEVPRPGAGGDRYVEPGALPGVVLVWAFGARLRGTRRGEVAGAGQVPEHRPPAAGPLRAVPLADAAAGELRRGPP